MSTTEISKELHMATIWDIRAPKWLKGPSGAFKEGIGSLHPISKHLIGPIQAKVAIQNLYQN